MRYFYQILVLVLLLILWYFSSSTLIPSPAKTLEAYEQIIANNSLQIGIIDSLYRYILGLIFGVIFGVFVGFIFGFNPKFASAFDPLFNLLRPISPIAWVPMVLIIFGIGDLPTIFIIAYSVFFPMVLLSTKAIRDVQSELIIVAKNFGASTEDASKVVEGKERSMHTMLGLILGNIADDMVKKIASGKSGNIYLTKDGKILKMFTSNSFTGTLSSLTVMVPLGETGFPV